MKFADDSVILSLLNNDDLDHGPVMADFIKWCKSSFLAMSISKAKEMAIDFRKNPSVLSPVVIDNQAVKVIDN